MNSDPHESAAWRTFGMLDADEAAAFDEAARHHPELRSAYREMECLTAAVAVATTAPVVPQHGQLERLHLRLGLNAAKQTNWLGISGWAAAAALTMILVFQRHSAVENVTANGKLTAPVRPYQKAPIQQLPVQIEIKETAQQQPEPVDHGNTGIAATQEIPTKTIVKVETKRLIQEIEVLKEKLEDFQERDRQIFEPVAGMSWPIVMRMSPPSKNPNLVQDDQSITAMLGDALIAANDLKTGGGQDITASSELTAIIEPSAIPIYDPARQTGTIFLQGLAVDNTKPAPKLWVETGKGKPIYVGQLPESSSPGPKIYDWALAPNTFPTGYILTQGDSDKPTEDNTILRTQKRSPRRAH